MTVCRFGNSEIEVDNIVGDDGKESLHFRHPLKGIWCQSIDAVLSDMNKYYDKKKAEWASLAEHIKNDGELREKVNDNVKEEEYI